MRAWSALVFFALFQAAAAQAQAVQRLPFERPAESLQRRITVLDEHRLASVGKPLLHPRAALSLTFTGEVQLTPEIRRLAGRFAGKPYQLADYVKKKFTYEPFYYGSVKGAQETLLQGGGNDYDLATLLVALLRANGIAAGYRRGTVRFPAAAVRQWLGLSDLRRAGDILVTAGYPALLISSAGQLSALQIERVWVEATVNGRNEVFDPAFKPQDYRQGFNPGDKLALDAAGLATGLVNAPGADANGQRLVSAPLEALDQRVAAGHKALAGYLQRRPELSLGEVIGGLKPKDGAGDRFGNDFETDPPEPGPEQLAFSIIGDTETFAGLPESVKQRLQVSLAGLSHEFDLATLAGERLTVGFKPASSADQAAIAAAGSMLKVAPGSVNLIPELKLGDRLLASGAAAPIGELRELSVEFRKDGQLQQQLSHQVAVGGKYAFALDSQRVSPEKVDRAVNKLEQAAVAAQGDRVLDDAVLGELLHILGMAFFGYQDKLIDYASGSEKTLLFHQVSEALIGIDLRPRNTREMTLTGYEIDNLRNIYSSFPLAGAVFNPKPLNLAVGIATSALEALVLRRGLGWPAVSTTKLLREAADQEIPLLQIDPGDSGRLRELALPAADIAWIRSQLDGGLKVIVQQAPVDFLDWRGSGWIAFDQASGLGGYFISGGLAGGAQALSFNNFSAEQQLRQVKDDALFLVDFWRRQLRDDLNGLNEQKPWLTTAADGASLASGLFTAGDLRDLLAAGTNLFKTRTEREFCLLINAVALLPPFGDYEKKAPLNGGAASITAGRFANFSAAPGLYRGVSEDADQLLVNLAKNNFAGSAAGETLGGAETIKTGAVKNRLTADHYVVEDGATLVRGLGLDPADNSAANRLRIGGKTADLIAAVEGWMRVDTGRESAGNGIDRVYRDPADGRLVILEAKFLDGSASLGRSMLELQNGQTELTDAWLRGANGAIQQLAARGAVDQTTADALTQALAAGSLRKTLLLVRNRHSGRTVSDKLSLDSELGGTGSSGIDKTVIVELAQTLPPLMP